MYFGAPTIWGIIIKVIFVFFLRCIFAFIFIVLIFIFSLKLQWYMDWYRIFIWFCKLTSFELPPDFIHTFLVELSSPSDPIPSSSSNSSKEFFSPPPFKDSVSLKWFLNYIQCPVLVAGVTCFIAYIKNGNLNFCAWMPNTSISQTGWYRDKYMFVQNT